MRPFGRIINRTHRLLHCLMFCSEMWFPLLFVIIVRSYVHLTTLFACCLLHLAVLLLTAAFYCLVSSRLRMIFTARKIIFPKVLFSVTSVIFFSVCYHDNSRKAQPIRTKFTHTTFDWNISDEFVNGHSWSHVTPLNRGSFAPHPLKINIPQISANPNQSFTHDFWLE